MPLVERLTADQTQAVDVPAKLSARVRLLATGHGRKTDIVDAVSTAIAALTADAAAGLLRSVRPCTLAERTRRALARELVAEVRRLDRRIAQVDTTIGKAVATTASTLPAMVAEPPS